MKNYIEVGIHKPELVGREEYHLSIPELRTAIYRAAHNSQIVRQCQHRMELEGLNGEDFMTLVAYHALRMLQDAHEREFERISLDPRPSFIMREAGDCRQELADAARNSPPNQEGHVK